MEFQRIAMSRSGEDIEIGELSETNALDTFRATLTEEERNTPIVQLNEDQIYGYVKAMFMFQSEVIQNIMDCSAKSLILLSHRMNKLELKELNVKANFVGTKINVQEEQFHFSFTLINKVERSDIISEYADPDAKEPHEKIEFLINQKEKVLDVFHQVRNTFNDTNGDDTALTTAGILIVFETMSAMNMTEQTVTLNKLIKKENKINKSYIAIVNREELEFNLTHQPNGIPLHSH